MSQSDEQDSPPRPQLSIVIPLYQSASILEQLVQRLSDALPKITSSYEPILVDDSVTDECCALLQRIQSENPARIKAVRLMRNYGQHNALMCGFKRACGKFVVTMDDDLQNPPEEIAKLWECIHERNLDVVYGTYVSSGSKKHGRLRNLGSMGARAFYRLVFRHRLDPTSFRILRRVEWLDYPGHTISSNLEG